MGLFSFLVVVLFLGNPRNNSLSRYLPLKLSTAPCIVLLLSSPGWSVSSMTSRFRRFCLVLYILTARRRSILPKNLVFHERTKHVELNCHFVRQQHQAGLISLSFIPSSSQLADIFTKPLFGPSHRDCLGKLGILQASSTLRGRMSPEKLRWPMRIMGDG